MNTAQPPPPWNPVGPVRQVGRPLATSMGTTRFRMADGSDAWLKAMGNAEGPHCLACELVATKLADWFGLPVAPHAAVPFPAELRFVLRPADDGRPALFARPGPAFASRHVPGREWEGSPADLLTLANPADITRLIVFDTWVRNWDRYCFDPARENLKNVYLGDPDKSGRRLLYAIDHTHCFNRGRELTRSLADIGTVRDEATYGLFPAFAPLVQPLVVRQCGAVLRSLQPAEVAGMVRSVPAEWEVPPAAGDALAQLILGRAAYLAHRIESDWTPAPPGPAVAP